MHTELLDLIREELNIKELGIVVDDYTTNVWDGNEFYIEKYVVEEEVRDD